MWVGPAEFAPISISKFVTNCVLASFVHGYLLCSFLREQPDEVDEMDKGDEVTSSQARAGGSPATSEAEANPSRPRAEMPEATSHPSPPASDVEGGANPSTAEVRTSTVDDRDMKGGGGAHTTVGSQSSRWKCPRLLD